MTIIIQYVSDQVKKTMHVTIINEEMLLLYQGDTLSKYVYVFTYHYHVADSARSLSPFEWIRTHDHY